MTAWSAEERATAFRAMASDDARVVAEAAALIAFKARALKSAGRDPAELGAGERVDMTTAVQIARTRAGGERA